MVWERAIFFHTIRVICGGWLGYPPIPDLRVLRLTVTTFFRRKIAFYSISVTSAFFRFLVSKVSGAIAKMDILKMSIKTRRFWGL